MTRRTGTHANARRRMRTLPGYAVSGILLRRHSRQRYRILFGEIQSFHQLELPTRGLAQVDLWQSLGIQVRLSYGELFLQSLHLSERPFKGTECPQSLSRTEEFPRFSLPTACS